MDDFGLYVILTRPCAGTSHVAEACVRLGCVCCNCDEKDLPDACCCPGVRAARVTRGTDTLFFVNDRPDIAALCAADGLHLGQGDLSMTDARRIVGPQMLIGPSTHSVCRRRAPR
jgi:thiamine-phosphate pyrophosphorylase